MSEFNPTRKDLLILDEKLISLKNEKQKLVSRKVKNEKTLANLQSKYQDVEFRSKALERILS